MEDKLHFEILPKRQRNLFDSISALKWIGDFYLSGGTALALRLGHRRSVDLDFFAEKTFNFQLLKRRVLELGRFEMFAESDFILHGEVNSVEISFLNLPFPSIGEEIKYNNLRISSMENIAAMKLSAISSRGSRKDFIDLYFMLKQYSLGEMIRFFEKKYGKSEENVYCALKGIVYFVDAEKRPMPSMIKRVSWGEIKKTIIAVHNDYIEQLKRS